MKYHRQFGQEGLELTGLSGKCMFAILPKIYYTGNRKNVKTRSSAMCVGDTNRWIQGKEA